MKCKYYTIRSIKYKKYKFCRLKKQVILDECKNCLFKEYKQNKSIKNKTNKLKKIENKRFSIITENMKDCYYCHKKNCLPDKHEIYGGSNRIRSIKNGFVVPLCRKCHSNEEVIAELRIITQRIYEKNHTREEFIKIIGKSYL